MLARSHLVSVIALIGFCLTHATPVTRAASNCNNIAISEAAYVSIGVDHPDTQNAVQAYLVYTGLMADYMQIEAARRQSSGGMYYELFFNTGLLSNDAEACQVNLFIPEGTSVGESADSVSVCKDECYMRCAESVYEEVQRIVAEAEEKGCPDDWYKYEGGSRCYHVFDEKATRLAAENRCQDDHATLASIPNKETRQFIEHILEGHEYSRNGWWLGGQVSDWVSPDDFSLTWSDGSSTEYFMANNTQSRMWGAGEPSKNGEVAVFQAGNHVYSWTFVDAGDDPKNPGYVENPFICETHMRNWQKDDTKETFVVEKSRYNTVFERYNDGQCITTMMLALKVPTEEYNKHRTVDIECEEA